MAQDIIDKLVDLHRQAVVERSHYYVGSVVEAAVTEITMLRSKLNQIKAVVER